MTIRFGPPLIATKTLLGVNSLGVLGSQVPLSGDDGPGLMANDVFLPTDEVRLLILTKPPGNLFVYEDSSFIYTGTSGSGTYNFYKNGVLIDTYTYTFTIGSGSPTVMSGNLVQDRYNKLLSLTTGGSLPDMLKKFLLARGATSDNLNQAQKEFLLSHAMIDAPVNEMWYKYFESLNYPGQINEKEATYWSNAV